MGFFKIIIFTFFINSNRDNHFIDGHSVVRTFLGVISSF